MRFTYENNNKLHRYNKTKRKKKGDLKNVKKRK